MDMSKDLNYWLGKLNDAKTARRVASDAANEAEEQLEKIYLEQYQSVIGKCFKYLNSDGKTKFFTYFKVSEVTTVNIIDAKGTPSVYVSGITFNDHPERVGIHRESTYLHTYEPYPISNKEFDKAYQVVLAKLTP
jgi:hypothetical protein